MPNFSISSAGGVISQGFPGFFEFTWSDQAPVVDPSDPNNPNGFVGDPFKATLQFNAYSRAFPLISGFGEDFISISVNNAVEFPYVVEVRNTSLELSIIQLLQAGTANSLTKTIAPNGVQPALATLTQSGQTVSLPSGVINALITDSFLLDALFVSSGLQLSVNSSAATVDNIITQRFSTVSAPSAVPGPLPALGALSALGWSRRMRRRLRSVRQV